MDEGKRVLGVTVEDAEGAHNLGPAEAALVFLFDDTGGGGSAPRGASVPPTSSRRSGCSA